MRARSNSGVRLDYYSRLLTKTVLVKQNPVTGLLGSNNAGFESHAWVRDNVYAVHAVWAVMLAYKKRADFEEERVRVYQLEQACVMIMRSLLLCMMRQVDKVEKFKKTNAPRDALHAKYSESTLAPVCGDGDWGHLQIDATSLFLLTLAQMTASGLYIVYNLDEVSFIQNLVFYIEAAYRIPDYGIWERGDKMNIGVQELNASSIGMAKAALDCLSDLDLFGARGSPASVIHVMADEVEQCSAVLHSMLPRESNSKELDAALLSVISYPAFACTDAELIDKTRREIINRLEGKYGCARFLRDGYKTSREDPNRLYYEPNELARFEDIECQWPLFFCYLLLDALYKGDTDAVKQYRGKLEKIVVHSGTGLTVVPELYSVPAELVDAEIANPGSQNRQPFGATPFIWAQSLYILAGLLEEGFLTPAELDPLNRRLCTEKRPDVVVQVVVLAETSEIQEALGEHGVRVQTVEQIQPYTVLAASILGKMYAQLGRSSKLGLTGRPSEDLGLLTTSKLYVLDDRVLVFTPQFMDWQRFYTSHDMNIMIDVMKSELVRLKTSWNVPGRPVMVISITNHFINPTGGELKKDSHGRAFVPPEVLVLLKKIKTGYLAGTRLLMGRLDNFITTSCMVRLNFMEKTFQSEIDPHVAFMLRDIWHHDDDAASVGAESTSSMERKSSFRRRLSQDRREKMRTFSSLSQRRRTLVLSSADENLALLRLAYNTASPTEGLSRRDSLKDSTTPTPTGSQPGTPKLSLSGTPEPFAQAQEMGTPVDERFGSPFDDVDGGSLKTLPGSHSERHLEELNQVVTDDLIDMLVETEDIEEQADILHCLWLKEGPRFDTQVNGEGTTVKRLLEQVHVKACNLQIWWLARHTAGLVKTRVDDVCYAVTDLLVRGKQLTIGMPAVKEEAIIRPLPPEEIPRVLSRVFGNDTNSLVLTEELLIYLGMFVRTEPSLFSEMLRLRVGLIIQVMASELSRTLHCNAEEAAQTLLNLSPYEMKTLLHHILCGLEFAELGEPVAGKQKGDFITHQARTKAERTGLLDLKKRMKSLPASAIQKVGSKDTLEGMVPEVEDEEDVTGKWLRRRRIDGALNRVPMNFYPKIWSILRKCESIHVESSVLHGNLTRDMTQGESKFALTIESVFNKLPEPEYRQLMVEALMVVTIVAETQNNLNLKGANINLRDIVVLANHLFVEDQKQNGGDSTLCCGKNPPSSCDGVAGLCVHFIDSPPSGRFGTLTYMCRAVAQILHHSDADIECAVS